MRDYGLDEIENNNEAGGMVAAVVLIIMLVVGVGAFIVTSTNDSISWREYTSNREIACLMKGGENLVIDWSTRMPTCYGKTEILYYDHDYYNRLKEK